MVFLLTSIRKNFKINRDHSNKKVEKQGQSSTLADILNPYNSANN